MWSDGSFGSLHPLPLGLSYVHIGLNMDGRRVTIHRGIHRSETAEKLFDDFYVMSAAMHQAEESWSAEVS